MGLTMSERRSLTEEVVRRYRRAGKKEKGVILGEFVKSSGYKRKKAQVRDPSAELVGAYPLGAH